ncbi:MAG TPA: DUF502 domain-containing protein [Candidatus Babeliales bacterium]|nr:DUF502 domain-containing protein [Candidatus Babeliales bacterium]
MIKELRKQLSLIIHYTWSIFLNGLFTLLPITLTIAVFNFSLRLLKNWVAPINRLQLPILTWTPHADVILVIILIFLTGIILRLFIIRSIIHAFEKLLLRIPFIRPLYSGIKQLVFAFDPKNNMSFKKIVIVQFPRPGIYSIGFMTGEFPTQFIPNTEVPFVNVFIPTTPNPTSGFLVVVPMSDITVLTITHQEAMALIMSGGIIQPKHFEQK